MDASFSLAFRYFSAPCWAWKQTGDHSGFFLRRDSAIAGAKSSSALAIQSRVLAFIHHLPAIDHQLDEHIALAQSFGDEIRFAHEQIQRERRVKPRANLPRLADFIAAKRKNDEQIHIRIHRGFAVSVR